MKIKEVTLPTGGKVISIILKPSEVSQLTMEVIGGVSAGKYWFDTIVNDTEYNVSFEVDWSERHDGTVSDN
jgi:hypothetical protein